jgi:hypothetical protein
MLPSFSRRQWLQFVGHAGLGVALTPWAWLSSCLGNAPRRANQRSGFGKARSVLLVYASGGQSQLDTWDPKPDAPAEIRGEFGSIATAVPSLRVCEHMPRLARLADRYTVLRSVSHDDLDHGSATYLALTGNYHSRKSSNPSPLPIDLPTYGAVVKRVRPIKTFPYTAVHVNGPVLVPETPAPGQFGGCLGRGTDPLVLADVNECPTAMRGLEPVPDLPAARRQARQALLDRIEHAGHSPLEADPHAQDVSLLYRQAHELLSSPQCRLAFDLTREKESVRDRYGHYRSGQACLLARRMVEAGVPFVTVFLNHTIRGQDKTPEQTDTYGWDTHNDIFHSMKVHLLPRFDLTFSALLEDLDQRGLLDQTLVVCMGEFGRAPRVALEPKFAGSTPGRKHWASVYSVVLAGAGVARGGVVGSSDAIGGQPRTVPVGPWDLAATMFAALGIDPAGHYQDLAARPLPIATGQPIYDLYR